jgi:hypothetical protein
MSHLGRPEGKDRTADAKYTVKPCADRPGKPVKSMGDFRPLPGGRPRKTARKGDDNSAGETRWLLVVIVSAFKEPLTRYEYHHREVRFL